MTTPTAAVPATQRPPLITIALLSLATLAYEVLLMRLFSIIQWHHFAYMIISLALLGYGASGTFLALTQAKLLPRYPAVFVTNLLLFGLSVVPCYLLAQQIPFNAEELLWDFSQPLYLLVIYLLLALPFFFSANAIALSFSNYRGVISRIYAFDLSGAGVGSLAVVLLLFVFFPIDALAIIGSLGLLTVVIATWELQLRQRLWLSLVVVVLMLPLAGLSNWVDLNFSPYKALSQTLRIGGNQIVTERSSPLGLISVVESSRVPLRHAPGLSLNATTEPPSQLGLFTDGNGMTVITQDTGDRQAFRYLDQLTSALPYHLKQQQHVLILGAGGGADIQQARFHRVPNIEAVELNPQIIELVQQDFASFAGHLYDRTDVSLHVAEARGFIEASARQFDLIQIALLDSFSASATGLYSLSENYLYTTEALQSYMEHLSSNGYLAITRWIKLPPRDTLKLFATSIETMRQLKIPNPERHLILIRGWQTSTLLIKNGVITAAEIAKLRNFCAERSFDMAYYPGMSADEANRYNILRQPYFYQAALALLGEEHDTFIERYKFNLTPATDDRPYFFNFFKWSALPEILELRGRGGMPLLEWGYLILIYTLLQALLASLLLILLPLAFLRHKQARVASKTGLVRVLVYFIAIGLAFLFIEIAFIQKFILFLHHPLYAAAVVLAAFLIFAGLGSAWSRRHADTHNYRKGVNIAVSGIVALGILYILALGPLFEMLITLPVALKIIITIALIAPLAFCMGMPFPLALASVGEQATALIPWAWGVNGCASVLSAVIATLLAIHFGFIIVVALACLLYVLAASAFPIFIE